MRIVAKQLLKQDLCRRVVFDENMSKVQADKHTKMDYLSGQALEFASDILEEFELPAAPEIMVVDIKGLESTDNLLKGTGYVELYASFKAYSGHKIRMDLYMPYARGELYRPSTVCIEGKRQLFSSVTIANLLRNVETTRPVMMDMYSPNRSIQHIENIEREPFSAPLPDYAGPYEELYIQDSYRR